MHHLVRTACLALLITIATSEAADRSRNWPWVRPKPQNSLAEEAKEIKRLLFNLDMKMQRFCRVYSNGRPLEVEHDSTHYKLQVHLSGCDEDKAEVRAGQRMVSIKSRDCEYMALKLLPEYVDTGSAFWNFRKGKLTVFFPYLKSESQCGQPVSDSVHSVPKLESNIEYPDVDVTFEDVFSTKNINVLQT